MRLSDTVRNMNNIRGFKNGSPIYDDPVDIDSETFEKIKSGFKAVEFAPTGVMIDLPSVSLLSLVTLITSFGAAPAFPNKWVRSALVLCRLPLVLPAGLAEALLLAIAIDSSAPTLQPADLPGAVPRERLLI